MEPTKIEMDCPQPIDRAYSITMTIRAFKGRKNVDVHLFRSQWDEEEMEIYDWRVLLGPPLDPSMQDPKGSRHILLESFTPEEVDTILNYLKEKYSTRLTAVTARPLTFPIPLGLKALSDMYEGKDIGLIRFEKIPSYSLDIPLHGLYDLSLHRPIAEMEE